MFDSLLVLAVTGLLIAGMRLLVFAYLWRRESSEHLRLWALGFMVQIFGQLAQLPRLLGHPLPLLQVVGLALIFAATALLLRGTWKLVGRTPDWRYWAAGALGLTVVAGAALGGSQLLATVVPVVFLSFAYFSMGYALFRRRRELSGLGVGLTIFALVSTAAHFADFPFLADAAWFVPWGIGLSLFNDVALTVGMVVLIFDRTHAAREQADARYAELADTLGVGTYTSTTPGRFSEVNGALVRMLGYSSAAEVLALELPRDLAFAVADAVALDSEVLVGADAVWRRKDGRALVVQLHARVLRDAGGQPLAWRGIVVDRTEAHAVEEALRRTQKLDAVGRLAGGVAHDFNNLLTIILSNLELLSLRPGEATPLRDALEATDQAAQLTRRLLAFGRKQASRPEPVDVGATALRTVQMLGRSLGPRHRVETGGVSPGLWINMDAGHLEQVLVNLVLNAKDAMSEGGAIEVSTRSHARGGRTGVELAVSDPGHGMTPEQQARIFEPFFTTREPGRGTGLGLSTVHGIVSQAGGSIDVHSAPGRGSRFTLWFPDTPVPQVAAPPAPGEVGPVAGKRVLVVDDEPGIRRTVCRMLAAVGHTTREASSGQEAVALVTAGERFDVMLSDVRMPEGDGLWAAQQVRALVPAMRVVLMSGYQDEADESVRAHADAFLAKPFTRGVLLTAIDAAAPLRAAG